MFVVFWTCDGDNKAVPDGVSTNFDCVQHLYTVSIKPKEDIR